MRISDYSEPLDHRRQEICQLSPTDPQRAKLKWQFFKEGDRLIQKAKEQNPTLDELNEHLKQLMDQARQLHPKTSHEKLFQREILNKCLESIQKSKKLWQDFQKGISHEEAYNEALIQLYEYFIRNHEHYDPTKSKVMTWLNFRLKNDWLTKIKKEYAQRRKEISFEEQNDDQSKLDSGIQAEIIYDGVCQWIHTDVHLKIILDKDFPKITLSYLLEQRFILDKNWGHISKETGIKVPTLSAWYERKCRPPLISFITKHYDVACPDTPLNPCRHIKGLLKEKDKEFAEQFRHWIETAAELKGLEFANSENDQEKAFSAYDFLCQLLEPKMSLNKLSKIFFVSTEDLERFYEFHILHLILQFCVTMTVIKDKNLQINLIT